MVIWPHRGPNYMVIWRHLWRAHQRSQFVIGFEDAPPLCLFRRDDRQRLLFAEAEQVPVVVVLEAPRKNTE